MCADKIPFDDVAKEISKYYSLDSNKVKILLVGHDGSLGGAQLLLMNIAKEFLKQDIEVTVLIKTYDILFDSYKEIAPTFLVDTEEKTEYYIKELNKCGYQSAILNTVLGGSFIPELKKYDFFTLSLVHELTGVINILNAYDSVKNIANSADLVVFPSKYVCEKFETINKVQGKKIILAQGLYNTYDNFNREKSRKHIEEKYGIPKNSNIIINVGTAEKRKGFDIFYEVSHKMKDDNYTFIWIGLITKEIEEYIELINDEKNMITTGYISDKEEIMSFYGACDLFLLSSREDPFPSVVLEAFNAKKPAIGFKNAGGFQDIVIDDYSGYLVEFESVDEIIEKIKLICEDEKLKERLGNNGKEILKNYDFSKYAISLKSYCIEGVLKININNLMVSQREIDSKNQHIKKLKQMNNEKDDLILDLNNTISELNNDNSNMKKKNAILKKTNSNLKKKNIKLKKANSNLKKKNTKLKEEKREILSSSSWKITDPLRKFRYSLRKTKWNLNEKLNSISPKTNKSTPNDLKEGSNEGIQSASKQKTKIKTNYSTKNKQKSKK